MTTAEHFTRRGCAPCKEPLAYTTGGLDNIFLSNGYEKDTVDGEEFIYVEDVEQLHRAIGLHLVKNRKALAGKEVKFIRKAMGLSQSDFAKTVGSTSQSVARWEKGQTELPGAADLMIRVNFLASLLDTESSADAVEELTRFAELVKNLATTVDAMDESRNEPVQFRHGGNKEWSESFAIAA